MTGFRGWKVLRVGGEESGTKGRGPVRRMRMQPGLERRGGARGHQDRLERAWECCALRRSLERVISPRQGPTYASQVSFSCEQQKSKLNQLKRKEELIGSCK